MSVMKENGERTILPRVGRDDFWAMIHERYAGQNSHRWKLLAILALRENAGWPLETIGAVFDHHRGHVSRLLTQVKRELRDQFERSPDWLEMGDPDEFMELHPESDPAADSKGFSNPDRP